MLSHGCLWASGVFCLEVWCPCLMWTRVHLGEQQKDLTLKQRASRCSWALKVRGMGIQRHTDTTALVSSQVIKGHVEKLLMDNGSSTLLSVGWMPAPSRRHQHGEGLKPFLPAAPDIHLGILGLDYAYARIWDFYTWMMCKHHDEKWVCKHKLAWGICLRMCNKFMLQCFCDLFFSFNSHMTMGMTVQAKSCNRCWGQKLEWKLRRLRDKVVSGRELLHWTSSCTQSLYCVCCYCIKSGT